MVFLRVENTFRVEFLRCCFSIFQPFAINLIKILGDGCSCWIISDLQSARIHQLGFWRTLSLDSLSRRINFRLFIIRISVYYVNHNVLKELLISKEKDDVAYVIQTITHICIRWGRKNKSNENVSSSVAGVSLLRCQKMDSKIFSSLSTEKLWDVESAKSYSAILLKHFPQPPLFHVTDLGMTRKSFIFLVKAKKKKTMKEFLERKPTFAHIVWKNY